MTNTLKQIWRAWKRLAQAIGDFIARIVLVVFYFTVFAPFGLGVRLFGDSLRTRVHSGDSHWQKRETHDRVLKDALRQ